MKKRSQIKIIKHRITAGLFSAILLFADVTSTGITVLAQETQLIDETVTQQEAAETENDATESPSVDDENIEGETPIPDGEDDENTSQDPDEKGDENEDQDPEDDNENTSQGPDEWDIEKDPQSPDEEDDEDGELPAEGEKNAEEAAAEEDTVTVDTDSGVEEQDIHTLASETNIIAYGSYKENDSDITWSIDETGKLTVAGKGEFAAVSSSVDIGRAPWHEHADKVKIAEIRVSGMTDASSMFKDCINLTSVDFSEFDTENITNMSNMFAGCISLTSLDLSGFDVVKVTSMDKLFNNCKNLETIYTPDHVNENLSVGLPKAKSSDKWYRSDNGTELSKLPTDSTLIQKNRIAGNSYKDNDYNITWSIDENGKLTVEGTGEFPAASSSADTDRAPWHDRADKIKTAEIRVSGMRDTSGMFKDCINLTSVDFSEFDTENVTNMSEMFYNCKNLKSLDLSRFSTGNVTNMMHMFDGCESLTSLKMTGPDAGFKTISVIDMSYMFAGCTSLKSLDVSSFDIASVKNMSYMFSDCSSLTILNVSGFESDNAENMSHLFSNCTSLKTLNVNGLNTDSVTDMSYMFSGCSSLTTLDVSGFKTVNVTDMSYMFSDCGSLKTLNISMFETANVQTMEGMFSSCSSLTSVNLNGLRNRNLTNMQNMFSGCKSLQNVYLDGFNTGNVTDMSNLFKGCSSLKTLDLDGFNVSSVTNLNGMFAGCSSLKTLNLDGFNVSSVTNLSGMFAGCKSLTTLDLSSFNVTKVTDMSNLFNGCSSLVSLDLSNFDVGNVTSMDNMLSGCSNLTIVYTPYHVNVSVALPKAKSSDKWYRVDGTTLTELPQNDDGNKSILIEKNKKVAAYGSYEEDGSNTKWFIDADGKLTVEGKGEFAAVSSSVDTERAPWHDYAAKIKTAEIRVSGMRDASGMFSGCTKLTKVDLSGFDTGIVANMSYMFAGCSGLTSLNVSGFNSVSVKSTSYMFSNCTSLKTLNVSGLDTDNVEDMSHMFENCKSLTSLDVSKLITGNVENMSYMFSGCASLKTLDLSMFNTANVIDMTSMFGSCSKLTSVNLSGFQTDNVENMSDLFNGCSSLKTLDLSNFDARSLSSACNMFSGCSNLKTLNLGNFDGSSIEELSGMFNGCKSLTTLDLSSFNVSNVKDMSNMFNGCSSLVSLDLSGFDAGNVTSMENMVNLFNGCSKLAAIYTPCNVNETLSVALPSGIWYSADDADGSTPLSELPQNQDSILLLKNKKVFAYGSYNEDGSNIKWFIDADGKLTVEGKGEFARESSELSDMDTPRAPWLQNDNVSQIKTADIRVSGMRDASGMFSGCAKLTKVDLSGFDTGSVTNMSNMFAGCSGLKSLDVSSFDTGEVTDMSHMFENCTGLTSLNVSGFDSVNVENMSHMFSGCTSLKTLNVDGLGTDSVTDLSYMFENCKILTSLDVSKFNTRNVTDMSFMFSGCASLKTLNISMFDTTNVKDMTSMFSSCKALQNMNLSGFQTNNVTDMSDLFNGCSSLKTLDLSSFKTDKLTYASNLFSGCSNLKTLNLGKFDVSGVKDLSGMFNGCKSLTALDLSGFDVSSVKDLSRMFNGCSSLASLDLSGFDVSKAEEMNDMFIGCSNLTTIYSPYHLKEDLSVALPKAKSSDKWYDADGEVVSELPQSLDYSRLFQKNKKPSVKAAGLKVVKKTTAYTCPSEKMDLNDLKANYADSNDLKVTYYDVAGNAYIIKNPEDTENPEESEVYNIDLEEPGGKEIDVRIPGKKILKVSYEEVTAEVVLTFTYVMTNDNITIKIPDVVYSGYPRIPAPIVSYTIDEDEVILVQGKDYTVSYENNINAGKDAKVIVKGQNDYINGDDPVIEFFTIQPAELTIQAGNITLAVGDELPEADKFPYEAIGLSLGDEDQLKVTGYSLIDRLGDSKTSIDTTNTGIYDVVLNVDEVSNYKIKSLKGKLIIAEERIGYAVTFDMMGHGDNIEIPGIMKAGSLLDIDELNEQLGTDIPTEEDGEAVEDEGIRYVFVGWYKNKTFAAKQKWNFGTDMIQADTTLYACWIELPSEEGGAPLLSLAIQDVQAQSYTGSAVKPTVYVYSADGRTLLKSGKDYTISYANNTNAVQKAGGNLPAIGTALVTNPGKKNEVIENISGSFSKDYPYIIITGKGNYSATIYKNFYILPADIGDENMAPAAGFTLKYSGQLVTNAKKTQNPFTSLKYKKAMVLGKDYTITLEAESDVKNNLGESVDPSEWSAETGYAVKTKKYTAPVIPKGYHGTFTMIVKGIGNYQGEFERTVVVTDKNHLMKNITVTLGKNQKSLAYQDGKALTLQPGYSETVTVNKKKKTQYYRVDKNGEINEENLVANAKDIFLIKVGGKYLVYGRDYFVSYTNNNKVGTATMTITGMGDYMGTKNVTFKITGTAFNTKNVIVKTYNAKKPEETVGCFMPSIVYTGKEITQNNAALTPKATAAKPNPDPLVYGVHYTISYKNNIKKGTATVTFKAKPESGYTGSFNKTFKVTARNLSTVTPNAGIIRTESDESGKRLKAKDEVSYVRGGAKLADRIGMTELLKNDAGIYLIMGSDYTITYKNNTAVTTSDMAANKKPYMIITGKGNYTGKLTIYFDIGKAKISKDDITVDQIAWNQKAKDTYVYKPGVKVVDSVSGKALSAGAKKDYVVTYEYNDQVNVTKYIMGEEGAEQPAAVIKVPGIGSYELASEEAEKTADDEFEIRIPLSIYKAKLTSSSLYVIIDTEQTTYTGKQVTPDVTVYYGATTSAVNKAQKDKVTDEKTLTNASGNYKLIKLEEKTDQSPNGDYTLKYGANTAAGTNKGSVTVTGVSKEFGGSVTVKFNIVKKGVAIIVRITSFTLNKDSIEGNMSDTVQLIGYIKPERATYNTVEWESADPQIAEVTSVDYESDTEVRVTVALKKEGMAIIKAYTDKRRVSAKCLVFVNSDSKTDENDPGGKYLTPQMYKNGSGSDYTDAFNKAIDYFGESNGHYDKVYVPAGTYKIDATKSIDIDWNNSNLKMVMSDKAVLKAIGNSKASYEVVHINGAGNVEISGGQIEGERYEHKGNSGEWGHGIGVYGGKNIKITNVNISDCWGDGIYLGSHNENAPEAGCNKITITDCILQNNRRNNLSIVCADNVTIDGCKFNNARGTLPEYGIDIETNNSKNPCEHITISNSTFDGNGQCSMGIVTAANDITIDHCTMNGMFLNYAGTNVKIKGGTVINGEVDARIGVILEDDTKINDRTNGTSAEDKLIATFDLAKRSYTISKYRDDNISYNIIKDSGSSSGKALHLKRNSKGTMEAGYCLNLSELTLDGSSVLKNGVTYRFEYHVKGSGQWGVITDQTGWYPCVPMSDKYSTGIVTYEAGKGKSCKLYFYAVDKTKGMELMIDHIEIYEVK